MNGRRPRIHSFIEKVKSGAPILHSFIEKVKSGAPIDHYFIEKEKTEGAPSSIPSSRSEEWRPHRPLLH